METKLLSLTAAVKQFKYVLCKTAAVFIFAIDKYVSWRYSADSLLFRAGKEIIKKIKLFEYCFI